jgi:hypothetical protein
MHDKHQAMPEDPKPDPNDLFGRRAELVHVMTCRLHYGPPMTQWDYYAIVQLGQILGMPEFEPGDEPAAVE